MQQKSVSVLLTDSPFKDFYDDSIAKEDEQLEGVVIDESKQGFMAINISEESQEQSQHTNPFFNSNNATVGENQTVKGELEPLGINLWQFKHLFNLF